MHMCERDWREYCLLERRTQWLEISNSEDYRDFPGRLLLLRETFSDVSADTIAFCKALADEQVP